MNRKVIGIDPSSTATGYAVMDGSDTLIEAGLLKPKKRSSRPLTRINDMVLDMTDLIAEHTPDRLVIEITSGKVNTNRHKGGGAGLPVYGMAVGALCWTAMALMPGVVDAIEENEWTRGMGKLARQAAVSAQYPQYAANIGQDAGMDISDAIGLLVWWFTELELAKN